LNFVIERGANIVTQLVAKQGGRYSVSCNTDMTLDMLAMRDSGRTDFILVGQVNSELPFMGAEAALPAEAFSHILDNAECDSPLFAPPKEPIDLADHAVGLHGAQLVPDRGTLQIGIGSMGDAVAHALILRHR